ncbi:MAG: hypothetical protein OJF47_004125 [Nitrospira sp.]|nr:MAG: hypothetical protein OJF47_004125 [Nitrospira sp.]
MHQAGSKDEKVRQIIETSALVAKARKKEFVLDIPFSFTYHTPPVPQDSGVAWCVSKIRNMLR